MIGLSQYKKDLREANDKIAALEARHKKDVLAARDQRSALEAQYKKELRKANDKIVCLEVQHKKELLADRDKIAALEGMLREKRATPNCNPPRKLSAADMTGTNGDKIAALEELVNYYRARLIAAGVECED